VEARVAARGFQSGAPVFIRIFKREFELELWLAKGDRFELFATYPICRFSGELGPKLRQGDKQAPEGIYTVARQQLNPASRWHRSFNLGFPNILDQHHGRTGTFLMVHGGCSSVGCYAMTNAVVDEVWHHVTRALGNGQRRFQVQVFPFRMTEAALASRAGHPWHGFWSDLKPAYDLFEASRVPPRAAVCDGRYSFTAGAAGSDGSRPLTKGCLSADPVVTN
jgi:murein L,D-transpeptidase YafK